MAQTIQATTADVLIAFQTRPGTEVDSLINAGDAAIKGDPTPVKPQGKGYYGLKLEVGSSAVLQVLGTDYHIFYQDKDEKETADKDLRAITNWKVTGDKTKLEGKQRRLQMLGYYQGRVDGKRGRKTEYAVLNFQADNKLRTDGDPGPKTRAKLDKLVEDENKGDKINDKGVKTGALYASRRTLVRFDWAPNARKPELSYGWPAKQAPMVDDRGSIKVKSAGIELHGPVVSVERKCVFRVKVIREFIDDKATLIATSDDESLVKIMSGSPLPEGHKFIMEMEAKDPGRKPKATSVKIKYRKGETETEIGSLQVIVQPRMYVKTRMHYITIKDAGGTSITPAGTPEGSATPADVQKLAKLRRDFKMSKALAREILRHYGIYLFYLAERQKTVTLSTAGKVSSVGGGLRSEFKKIMEAVSTGNANVKKELNILVCNDTEGVWGQCWDAVDSRWPNGIVVKFNPEGVLRTAGTLAHEIGHFMSWANCLAAGKWVHSDDDPDSGHKKTDYWTVAKLMYSYGPHDRPFNPGFGYKKRGGKVTIRNLPSDPTDDETYSGIKWFKKGDRFYCQP